MPLPPDVQAVRDELIAAGYPDVPGFDAYCCQVAIERDAAARIAAEGLIVADVKGTPVPHPALEVQRKAQAEMRAWVPHLRPAKKAPRGAGWA